MSASDPTARVIRATRRRLAVVTLAVFALLVVGIGAATAVIAVRALDDRSTARSRRPPTRRSRPWTASCRHRRRHEGEERAPQASDTFFLFLDPDGALVANPSGVALTGLPDRAALAAARCVRERPADGRGRGGTGSGS